MYVTRSGWTTSNYGIAYAILCNEAEKIHYMWECELDTKQDICYYYNGVNLMQVLYISVKQALYRADSRIHTNYSHFVMFPCWLSITPIYL